MESLEIACPQCGKLLKLKDPKLLGRKGKCAKCGHLFVMQEPEPVELEPVDESAVLVSQIGQPKKSPLADLTAKGEASPFPAVENKPAGPIITDTVSPGLETLREIRQRNKKSSKIAWGVTIASGLLLALAVWWLVPEYQQAKVKQPSAKAGNADASTVVVEKTDDLLHKEQLEKNYRFATSRSPTSGEPIDMHFVPAGARIIFHLRPAELWTDGGLAQEVRYCLGPLTTWAESKLKEICLREPAEIEETTICLALGSPSMPPDVSAVVRLKDALKPSDFVQMFQGKPDYQYGYKITLAGDRAFMIADESGTVFANCPAHLAREMVEARSRLQPTDPAIEAIIADTDRDRHVSLVFIPLDLTLEGHQETLLPNAGRAFFTGIIDWLGDDVEAVAWSMHLGDEFRSDMVIRNDAKFSVMRTQRHYADLMNELPKNAFALVRQMNPKKVGARKIIGRYPAMLKALQLATLVSVDDRHVMLSAQLPERAAPNLALGTLLAWDESTRTDFSTDAAEPPTLAANKKDANLPEKIADRLKKKIDVDFRRTPLQEAFNYIAEETSVKIEIDGDALKFAGFTKNMPQTFQMSQQPALGVIQKIVQAYDKMCLVIDEKNKQAIITTYPSAKDKNLQPYEFEKPMTAKVE